MKKHTYTCFFIEVIAACNTLEDTFNIFNSNNQQETINMSLGTTCEAK